MSGGSSAVDPYYRPTKPKKEVKDQRPKRVVVSPSGKRRYVYDCAGCGKEFTTDRHRHSQKKYHSEECRRRAFGALNSSRRGKPRTKTERENMSEGQRKAWADSEKKARRMEKMGKAKRHGPIKRKRESRAKTYAYTCTGCGRFYKTARKKTGKDNFHSADYRNHWQKTKKKGEEIPCANPNCDKKFYRKASRSERKYCSMRCAKSDPEYWERVTGTKKKKYGRDWEWEGWHEKRTDRAIWIPLAAAIRGRDKYKCQACGKKWHRDDRKFPVHHMLPRSKGGPDEPWNLMTLCPSCHRKADGQKSAIKYPFESQTRIPDFGEDEGESVPLF